MDHLSPRSLPALRDVGALCRTIASPEAILIIVTGPPTTRAFHINPSPELLYQLFGTAVIEFSDGSSTTLKPGDSLLIEARKPHRPVREEGSLGVVVERPRLSSEEADSYVLLCDVCGCVIADTGFGRAEDPMAHTPFDPKRTSLECAKCRKALSSIPIAL